MKTNANPFSVLLDQYSEGSEQAYQHLLQYTKDSFPSLISTVSLVRQRLFRISFAYLCADYTNAVKSTYQMEDFEYLIGEMSLEKYKYEIYYLMGQANIEWEDGRSDEDDSTEEIEKNRFEEMLWSLLIVSYRKFWKEKLYQQFKNDVEIHNYFVKTIFEEEVLSAGEESDSIGFISEI